MNEYLTVYLECLGYIIILALPNLSILIISKKHIDLESIEQFTYKNELFLFCIVAIIEEIIFRDFLQRQFLILYDFQVAYIINSVLFGLTHLTNFYNTKTSPQIIIQYVVYTTCLGYIFNLPNNIYISIALHLTLNSSIVIFGIINCFIIEKFKEKNKHDIFKNRYLITKARTIENSLCLSKYFSTEHERTKWISVIF